MKSSARTAGISGLLALVVGIGLAALPQSEEYSDYGFGTAGLVDVKCGSVFAQNVELDFRDYEESRAYWADKNQGYDPRIFEGQTATEVCDEKISSQRTAALTVGAVGAVLLVAAMVLSNRKSAAPHVGAVDVAVAASGERTQRPEPGSSATEPESPAAVVSPAQWVEDPFERHQHRYWNGKRWTDRVSDNGVVGTDPPVATKSWPVAPVPSVAPAPPVAPVPPEPSVPTACMPEERVPSQSLTNADVGVILRFADGRVIPLTGTIVVGRSPAPPEAYPGAELVTVADLTVSKSHAAVGFRGTSAWVCDLDSSNGVVVLAGGVEHTVAAGTEVTLNPGDRVSLGDATAFVVDVDRPDQTMPRTSSDLAPRGEA